MSEGAGGAYHIVFQVGVLDQALNLLWLILPLAFLVMGIAYIRGKPGKSYLPEQRVETIGSPVLRRILGVALVLVAALLTYALVRLTVGDFLRLRAALRDGHYSVAEGAVENFVPMPYQGHATEHFTVQGVPFSYSTYEVTSCFNHTSSHGGPVRAGLRARIAYVAGRDSHRPACIIRLEMADAP